MKELVLRPEATADLREAWLWYENERKGLGDEMLEAVRRRLLGIQQEPRLFAPVHHEIRRALVMVFPFAIYFVIEPQKIVVLAIQHTARSPDAWRRRA